MRNIIISLSLLVSATLSAQQPTSLSLAECREMALRYNESLIQQNHKLESAQLDEQIAKAQSLPMVDGSLMGLYMKDQEAMGMTIQMRGLYDAGITVKQPIYVGGQITAGRKLAAIGVEAARQQIRKTHDQIIADADQAYYTLLSVREKVKMLQAYQRQMDGLFSQVETSVHAEMATGNDLLRINAKRSEISYQLQKARNGENLCRMALCNAIGLELSSPIVITDSVITVHQPSTLDESIANRPEIELLNQQVKASELQIKMARANYLPTVALVGGYSYMGGIKMKGATQLADGSVYNYTQNYHSGNPMALLSVSIPIFHWGSEFKKVKKAQLSLENAQLDLQKNTRLMNIEAKQAVQNMMDGYRMVETAELGSRQSDENLRVMQQKFDNGMATMTDLLDAQSQWQQSRSNLIEAKTQYKIYETEYKRVTGNL